MLKYRVVWAVTYCMVTVCVTSLWLSPVLADDVVMKKTADDVFFELQVRPILAGTCFKCHGGEKVGGGLRVDSREALLKRGRERGIDHPGQT